MGSALSAFIQRLVTEAIRRNIAKAIATGSTISSAAVAEQVCRLYPNCGLAENEIADQVMIAAAKSGVAVEIGGERMRALPGRTAASATDVPRSPPSQALRAHRRARADRSPGVPKGH